MILVEVAAGGLPGDVVIERAKAIGAKYRGDHVLALEIETAAGKRTLSLGPPWRCSAAPVVLAMLAELGEVSVREHGGPPC